MTKFLLLIALLLLPASPALAQDAPPSTQPAAEAVPVPAAPATNAPESGMSFQTELSAMETVTETGYQSGDFSIWMTLLWVGLIGVPLVVTLFFIATVRHKQK